MSEELPPVQPPPNINLGSSEVVGRGVRTGIQAVTGQFIVEGIELFDLYDFTEDQAQWMGVALTVVLALIQNALEKRRGRKFIGASPQAAVAPS